MGQSGSNELGAGEIVLTCMDADGTKDGYDLEITRAVAEAVASRSSPAAAPGSPEHLADAVLEGKASAALAASIFHFGETVGFSDFSAPIRFGSRLTAGRKASSPPPLRLMERSFDTSC